MKKSRCLVIFLILTFVFTSFPNSNYAETITLDTLERINYIEDTTDFVNPERGWHRIFYSDNIRGFDKLKSQGINMVLLNVNLKNFKTGPISNAKLTEINNAFASARKYGLKIIFRAAYDYDGVSSPEPKDLNIIKNHISQLKPIFYNNEDVLYVVQAGFLGPWGEWHSSYYGYEPSLEARKTVLLSLLDAVPKSRMVQIRRPKFIRDIFKNEVGGNVLTEDTAFSETNLSRTGFHNDAFLSTADDMSTYDDPAYNRSAELNWCNNHTKYTSFGGESDYLSNLSDASNAVFECSKLHAQHLNIDYFPSVITKWKNTTYNNESTYSYISKRLGYRFMLRNSEISTKVSAGGVLHLKLDIENIGFGNLINKKDFELVLVQGTNKYTAIINDDLRRLYRESGVVSKDYYFKVPTNIVAGSYNVYLNISDPAPEIKANPNYSIRLANTNMFNSTTGYNLIKSGLVVENSYTSTADTNFVQITRTEAEQILSGNTTATAKPTSTSTLKPTPTPTLRQTPTPTLRPTPTPTLRPTPTPTLRRTPTPTLRRTPTPTLRRTPTPTLRQTPTPTLRRTPTPTLRQTPTPTLRQTPTLRRTPTPTLKPTQQLTKISVDGYTSDWTSIPNIVSRNDVNTNSLKATSDGSSLFLLVSGTNLNNTSQFFIDSDNNYSTGYKVNGWRNSGAEYLIENNVLYKYTGTNNSWSSVGKITFVKRNTAIECSIPLNSLKINAKSIIHIGFILNSSTTQRLPESKSNLPAYILE